MRLLLLTARLDLETNHRLQEAATAASAQLELADAAALVARIAPPSLRCFDGELLAPPPRAVLARVGNWRPESMLAALETCGAAGVPTPNPPKAIRDGRDHWRTILCLAAAGVPAPATVAGSEPEVLAGAGRELGFPVVVKQRRSRMGVGVIRCDTPDHLEAVLDSLWRVGDEVVIQRFVPCSGHSLRLLVVGGRVVAAMRLSAPPGDWRSNASRGGCAEALEPSSGEAELAHAAAAALGLGICGVDLLPGADGTVVGEVNPTPGFRALEAATGADVASAIVAHLIALARKA